MQVIYDKSGFLEKKIYNNYMAGKGSKPRNCFSKSFKQNFDTIDWVTKKGLEIRNFVKKRNKKIYKYP